VQQAWAGVATAFAGRQQAAVAVLDADAALQRAERLHDSGTITLADHDTAVNASRRAHAGRAVADANVAAARAAFALAQANRDKATIRAPIAGVVLVRNVEPGQVVVSALQAAVLFRVAADLEHLEVRADVDEADVVKVAPGQEATFTVSAQPGSVYPARVRTVTNAPRLLQQVVTYEARLDVDNPAGTLRPGMTATVKIVTSHLPDVVLVPAQALRFVPSSARTPTATMGPPKTTQEATAPTSPRVWLLQGGVPVARAVVIVAGDGDRIAVTGVDGGDVVVVGEQAAR
jgi:HlyD family secretion protein